MSPAERESGPQGGRPLIGHDSVLKVIWFVLVTGCRWKDVPRELGCCGETARTRLQAWERAGIWDELHETLLTMLRQAGELHAETAEMTEREFPEVCDALPQSTSHSMGDEGLEPPTSTV